MRVEAFLDQLAKNIHGFWIPREDRFQGEYIHPYDERLAHITGFTGSAGLAIITRSASALFVDSRYTLQASQQSVVPVRPHTTASIQEFLENTMGGPIGCDPWLITGDTYQRWESFLEPLNHNPVDAMWQRPSPEIWDIVDHPLTWAGATTAEKLALHDFPHNEAYLICDPATLAWLCNIRAHCVPFTPIVPGWGLVWRNNIYIWAHAHDTTGRLTLAPEHECLSFLKNLPKDVFINYDPKQTPYAFLQALPEMRPKANPFLLLKSKKNKVEQQGMRDAHLRDGVAVTEFLAWLHMETKHRPVTEIEASERLLAERRKQENFVEPSFETISASAANGAVIHYRPEGQVHLDGLYLVDSGGQYNDGTTDVTRVIAISPPTVEQRTRYTQVLRGHIALARAVFPRGTTGRQLDVLARQYLWQSGCDYAHGTGHGVGSFLSVHESPPRVSPKGTAPLEEGMVLSNEPGYYKAGEYGVRLENMMVVVPSAFDGYLCFETLTLAPFELSLIDIEALAPDDLTWLRSYSQRVRDVLSPYLTPRAVEYVCSF